MNGDGIRNKTITDDIIYKTAWLMKALPPMTLRQAWASMTPPTLPRAMPARLRML